MMLNQSFWLLEEFCIHKLICLYEICQKRYANQKIFSVVILVGETFEQGQLTSTKYKESLARVQTLR
jgi:hypothetical protein